MIQLVQSKVVFNEENHTYFLGDKQLHGITGMIGKQLFPNKYADIPEFILMRAAERGTRVHSQCQFVDSTGFEPESIEAENYLKERMNAGYSVLANEYTVSDNEYFASNIDCVWEKSGLVSLADIKTTARLDRDYLSWQLSIYAYLFEMQNPLLKVDKLFGVWLRDNASELIEVERKPDQEVVRLMQCEITGEQYQITDVSPFVGNQLMPIQAVQFLIDMQDQLDNLEERKSQIMEACKKAMKENNIKVWDAGRLRVSITEPSKKNTFDSKKFQTEHPDLYSKYLKESITKESIRLTIRKEKDESE